MTLQLYNTLSGRVEDFVPLIGNQVRLYTCGPTVYDYAHIGNYRSFLFFDLLKRYLLFLGYQVKHVMNITDVDDRIIKRCTDEKVSLSDLTEKYKDAFMEDIKELDILSADKYPAATHHIPEIQKLILKLIKKGYAYKTDDGSVFFDISSFPEYGALSKVDLTGLTETGRVAEDEYDKENVRDFALWKGWKPEDKEVGWESPWGRGRPGWHVECSAMSMKYLTEEFDIHCGGVDLIFPHHENEIAQSVCASGKSFVNFWLHCEHLLVDGAKMSKSLGNYYIVRDLLKKGHSSQAIRYLLLSVHYRQKINLTVEHLQAAGHSVERLQDFKRRLERIIDNHTGTIQDLSHNVLVQFSEAMNEDLNIAEALGAIFNWVKDINRQIDTGDLSINEAQNNLLALRKIDSILGVIWERKIMLSEEDKALIEEREKARKERNWRRSDKIRDYFIKKGIRLEDTQHGTVVKRVAYSGEHV